MVNLDKIDMPQLCRHWTIEFAYFNRPYGEDLNVSNHEVLHSLLLRLSVIVWPQFPFEGRRTLVIIYRLKLRNNASVILYITSHSFYSLIESIPIARIIHFVSPWK